MKVDDNAAVARGRTAVTQDESPLEMSELMHNLYFKKKNVDETNVSVHSAFICMLHLANEKGLAFDQLDTTKEDDFEIMTK